MRSGTGMAEYTKAAAAHYEAITRNFSCNKWRADNLLLISYKQTPICHSATTRLASDESCRRGFIQPNTAGNSQSYSEPISARQKSAHANSGMHVSLWNLQWSGQCLLSFLCYQDRACYCYLEGNYQFPWSSFAWVDKIDYLITSWF